METYYQNKHQEKKHHCQGNDYSSKLVRSEVSAPLDYTNKINLREKEKIFKDIYSSIEMFNKLVCEARKTV